MCGMACVALLCVLGESAARRMSMERIYMCEMCIFI